MTPTLSARPSGPPLRRRVLLSSVITGGVLVFGAGIYRAGVTPATEPVTAVRGALCVVIAALIVCAHQMPLRLQFRADRMAHVWDEVPLVLGLGLLSGPDLLVVTWLGSLLAHASSRRGLTKTLYNAGAVTLGTLVVVVALGRLAYPPPLETSSLSVAILIAAALSYSFLTNLAISAVVSGMRWPLFQREVLDGFWLDSILSLTSGLVGISFLLITGDHYVTLAALPFIVGGLHGAQASALRVVQEREAWARLDAATRELNQLNHDAVRRVAVARSGELFRCDGVELLLARGSPGMLNLTALGAVGGPDRSPGPERPVSVVNRPLVASGVRVGELRLYYATPVLLSERESWALSTFSRALTAALLNADLYEKLQRHAERKAHEAAHDALTGLANRTVLTERGAELVEAAVRHHRAAALFLVDLDHFKDVNDSLGHDVGDQLLRETGRRLVAGVRPSDLVVRLGGDEFALLMPDLNGAADLAAAKASISAALAGPAVINGIEVEIAASIGVALAPADGVAVADLLRRADAAMYRAKAKRTTGPAPQFASPGQEIPAQGGRCGRHPPNALSELHPSLHRGELEVHFQPKVDLRTGAANGAEALARWRTPSGKLLDAYAFMPVIEASNLVSGFARQVLDRALAAAASWSPKHPAATVAVNLSARDLLDRSLPGDVDAALHRHGVAPCRLILEITETVMMSQLDVVDEVLHRLAGLGVQLSVDDFGTGFSSLTFLSHVDVHELKIDQSFVARMLSSSVDATIVETLLGLGERLGLRVVAEGVENSRQRDHLAAMGCESAQGFFLARPMSAPDLGRVLALSHAGLPPRRAPIVPKGRG